jgi:hypothetical protein
VEGWRRHQISPTSTALAIERIRLQRRLSDLVRRYERLQEQVAFYPNDVTVQEERRLAAELKQVNGRIDEIDATLIPFRLTT